MKFILLGCLLTMNAAMANFYGQNDRVRITYNDPIRYLVGKVLLPGNAGCTGSLIASDLVLTAAHCLYNSDNRSGLRNGAIYFELGRMGDGQAIHRSQIANFYLPPSAGNRSFENSDDFAIVQLRTPVDPRIKPFKIVALTRRSLKRQPLKIAGYGQLTGNYHITKTLDSCFVRGYPLFSSFVSHDCDMSSGDSGAPLYNCNRNGCTIYALNVSEERTPGAKQSLTLSGWTSRYPNYAIVAYKFQAFLNTILNQ